VVTAKIGGNAMVWHMRLGQVVLALLVFRIVWGLVGGRWSRFTSFLYAPGTVLRYLRGDHRSGDHFEVGHSPLGAFSVFALITLLLVQVGTGLVADDEIATTGPLNRYVASATGLLATGWHKHWGQWILLGLVALHVVAIVVYKLRGKNLVTPMLTGDKPLPADVPASTDSLATRGLAAVVMAACAALSVWIARQGG
jgi:cytochrome b